MTDTGEVSMRCDSRSVVSDAPQPGHEKSATVPLPLRVITRKELRLLVSYTPQHILRLENQDKFPKRIPIGERRVGWYLHEVLQWLEQKRRKVA